MFRFGDDLSCLEALQVYDLESLRTLSHDRVDVMVAERLCPQMTGRLIKSQHRFLVSELEHANAMSNSQALYFAALNGKVEEVQRLLAAGALPDGFTGEDGWSALMYASFAGQTDIVRALLSGNKRADPDLQMKGGNSALLWASSRGHTDIVHELLAAGANPGIALASGKTSLSIAEEKKFVDVAALLREHDATISDKAPA